MYAYALNMHGDVVAEAEAPSAARAVFKAAQMAATEEHIDITFAETTDREFGQDGVFEVWIIDSAALDAAVPRPGSRLAA